MFMWSLGPLCKDLTPAVKAASSNSTTALKVQPVTRGPKELALRQLLATELWIYGIYWVMQDLGHQQ